MANCVHPSHTAPLGAIRPESTLFAQVLQKFRRAFCMKEALYLELCDCNMCLVKANEFINFLDRFLKKISPLK